MNNFIITRQTIEEVDKMETNEIKRSRLSCCNHNNNNSRLHQQQKRPIISPCRSWSLLYSLLIIVVVMSTSLLIGFIQLASATTNRPTFIDDMNMHTIKENTKIGEEIYTLLAQDSNGAKVIYGIEETNLFNVDKYSGKVKVINNIDFESTGANLRLVVTATNTPTLQQIQQKIQPPTVKMSIDVNILDENDNPPKIVQLRLNKTSAPIDASLLSKKPFRLDVSEDTPINTILIAQIQANDKDTIGDIPLTPICLQCEPEFELITPQDEQVSNQKTVFALRTKTELNYIPKNNVRSLTLMVTDGKFNASLLLEVNILDQQNKPPIFIGSTTAIVPENVPLDTRIMTIKAIDGDAIGELPYQIDVEHQRQVVYRFADPRGVSNYFRLLPISGDLLVANRLDREEFLSTGGIITFTVQAIEVMSNTQQQQQQVITEADYVNIDSSNILDYSVNASSEVIIKVLLIDVNDNSPQWLNSSDVNDPKSQRPGVFDFDQQHNPLDTGRIYEVNIEENSPPGTPLNLLDMYVQDIDSGVNNQFRIDLLDPSGKFDVEPKYASGHTSVSLRVAKQQQQSSSSSSSRNNAPLLDYENLNERKFVLQVVATETKTKEKFSSIATVKVNVINVNDNAPEFKDQYYRANVKEDAPHGRSILSIKAYDKDRSEISYSLIGHSAHLFDINSDGLVTVARCARIEGSSGCIDYETQKQHQILVQASDGQLSAVVSLTIYVEDVSDNSPVMVRKIFSTVIEEGFERFEPPLKVEAHDDDLTSIITYSIVEGNFEGLFSINNSTGEIQLTRKIKLGNNDGRRDNNIRLIVQATDGLFYSNATVLIEVLDSNDNAPTFVKNNYSIDFNVASTAASGSRLKTKTITQLHAQDADTGSNAKLSYRIQRGSFGLFGLDENTGTLYVEDNARFDIEKKSYYELEVIAIDHGVTSKTGTTKVHIRIGDTNRKSPQFAPTIQRVEVTENVPINTVIHRLQATSSESDLEMRTKLIFTAELIEARDKNGDIVRGDYPLRSKLSVDSNSGDVVVTEKLDHDQVAYINLTVSLAEESDLDLNLKSYGYLLITVKDYNDNPPFFAVPWSPATPELHFTMEEEKPINTVLTQLMASDIDSKISYFKIDPPNDYFELLSPQSGVIVNKRVIDYDKLMSTNGTSLLLDDDIMHFSVSVFDSGVPLLSAQARIYVKILPINDWDCKFNQSFYSATIRENSLKGTFVVQTEAHDNDWGQQGRLVYRLYENNMNGLFSIDALTGILRVGPKFIMATNKEKQQSSSMTVHVIASDNQSDLLNRNDDNVNVSTDSRTCSVPVRITIKDINENPPLFSKKTFEVLAYDGDYSVAPIVKLSLRNTLDSEISSRSTTKKIFINQYFFKISSGNTNEMFNITDQGLIYSVKSFNLTKSTEYRLKVEVSQHQASIISDECDVIIKVIPLNRYSPEFTFPPNSKAYVNESGPIDQFVTQIMCIDKDYKEETSSTYQEDDEQVKFSNIRVGYSDRIRYSFKVNDLDVQETNQFRIDAKTGNITTKISLDREAKAYYELIVACNDNGLPQALETLSPINIIVLDIDDNEPEFLLTTHQRQQNKLRQLQLKSTNVAHQPLLKQAPSHHNVAPVPIVEFQVDETQGRNMLIGEIKAIDQDELSNPILYCIIDGNEYQEFHIDRDTGLLYANQTLDREKQSSYNLIVKAINDGLSCEDHVNKLSKSSSVSINSAFQLNSQRDLKSNSNSINNNYRDNNSLLIVKIQVNDINDNAPIFKKNRYKAGIKHRALVNTTVTQVVVFDPDNGINATVSYKISEVILHKRQNLDNNNYLGSPQKLLASPFRIDKNGYVYTTQLLTNYPLTTMFTVSIEAQERVPTQRIVSTKLDIWTYETYHQVKMKVNLSPKTIESYREEIEAVMSNITKYSAIINDVKSYYDTSQWINAANHNLDGIVSASTNHGQMEADVNRYHINHKSTANKFTANTQASDSNNEEATSNIYLIFVDDANKLINPQTVIERFDLSSAHLFRPLESKEIDAANNNQQRNTQHFSMPVAEPFIIDNIALASPQLESLQQYSILSNEIIDIPTLFVIVTGFLTFIGSIMMCIGCCCMKNWYRDHLIRQATKKLIKQHTVQAKINEQMLAAAAMVQQQQDIMSASSANMASLDAINCTNNNNDNISIIRAMNASNNNNSTLQGIVNQGAHFYDNPLIDDNGTTQTNNGMATVRGGLTNAQRRQQLPNEDHLHQKIQPTSWDEEKMTTTNDE